MELPDIVFCLTISHDERGFFKYGKAKDLQFRNSLVELKDAVEHIGAQKVGFVLVEDLRKAGVFEKYYLIDTVTENGIIFSEITTPICPRTVINRRKDELYTHALLPEAPWKIYNPSSIARFGNKKDCYEVFGSFMPKTAVVDKRTTADALATIITAAKEKKFIFKPLRLNGGRGLVLINGADVRDYVSSLDEPYIMQEFIETSAGAAGLAEGRHDVRLYVVDGMVMLVAVRHPADGGLFANTSLGGSIEFFPVSAVPESLRQVAVSVLKNIRKYGERYFISLDFFYGNGKWYLIEINDQPGVPANYQTDYAEAVVNAVAYSLKEYDK